MVVRIYMNLRDYAKDKPCLVRTPMCNGDSATTVLAHIRMIGISGMGLKAPDLLGAHCCSACHSFCDVQTMADRKIRELLLLQGMARTINLLIKENIVSW